MIFHNHLFKFSHIRTNNYSTNIRILLVFGASEKKNDSMDQLSYDSGFLSPTKEKRRGCCRTRRQNLVQQQP
jgi:hypothetical protein